MTEPAANAPHPATSSPAALLEDLARGLGTDVLVTDGRLLGRYGTDATGTVPLGAPAAVVLPRTVEEVQHVLRAATAYRAPVVTRGAGSGLSGAALAPAGGIVLCLERMDRILALDPVNRIARAEAGVITQALDAAAAPHGLWYAPDPASSGFSTIGGNIATNAGGLHCVKYGVTREAVLALDMVLADGTRMRLGSETLKGVTGYDLVSLVVGSEGTLAVVVGATVRLRPRPPRTAMLQVVAASLPDAGAAVATILAGGAQPSTLELMDRGALELIDHTQGTRLAALGDAMLLVETDSLAADAERDEIAARLAGRPGLMVRALAPDEAATLVELRRTGRGVPDAWQANQDVAVPVARLAEMLATCRAAAAERGLGFSCVAHAGDGNLHTKLTAPRRPGEHGPPPVLQDAAGAVIAAGLALGGTLTGEHGVGTLKRPWLEAELGAAQLELQRAVKRAFDPLGILAPDSFLAAPPPGG